MATYEIKCRAGTSIVPVKMTLRGSEIYMSFPFNRDMVDEVKAMAGKKWHPELKVWSVANCKRNLFAIDILTDGPQIAVYDSPIHNWVDCDYEINDYITNFWTHQQEDFNFILTRHRCIIAGEMRTGKTYPTLAAVMVSDFNKVWWVAPKSALRGLEVELKKRNFKKDIELLTYENFKKYVKTGQNVPGFIVFDECQKLKTPTSQQTTLAIDLAEEVEDKYHGKEYIVGLSGTPAPRDPSDWWSICEVIRPGFIRESSKNALARRLGVWEQKEGAVGQAYWQLVKSEENPTGWIESEIFKLYRRLRPLVKVNLKKDCLDLPDKVYEVVEIKPSSKVLRVARTIINVETNALTARNRLRQLSDGFQYTTEYDPDKNKTNRQTVYVGSPKEDTLRADLDLYEDVGRIIIYAGFQGSIDVITRICMEKEWLVLQVDGRGWVVQSGTYYDSGGLNTDYVLRQMDRSQDEGTIPKIAFVAQTGAAGTGLELSSSPVIIFYSNADNGGDRMQAEDRPHSNNMDKERGLLVKDYCHLPTDYLIREQMLQKKELQAISMGDLKKVLGGKE